MSDPPGTEEHALVMSLETALVSSWLGVPGFVLDTGATENALGIKTLQDIIQKTGIRHSVSVDDRPVFRFGDGLSLRARSKVTLYGTSLGEVHFYTLDGDHRPQTHNAESTPALLGSKFLRQARATISYDRLSLWFLDSFDVLWATELLQTQSGHLLIPVTGQLLDLSSLKLKAEKEHGIRLPYSAACLLDVLSTPGALEELKQGQTSAEKIGDFEPKLACGDFSDMPGVSSVAAQISVFAVSHVGETVTPTLSVVQPQLSQRLRDLGTRLSLLRLRSSHVSSGSSPQRSSPSWLSMLGPTQEWSGPQESVRNMDGMLHMWPPPPIRGEGRPRQGPVWRGNCGHCGAGHGGAGGAPPGGRCDGGHVQWKNSGGSGSSDVGTGEGHTEHIHGEVRWSDRPERPANRGDREALEPNHGGDSKGTLIHDPADMRCPTSPCEAAGEPRDSRAGGRRRRGPSLEDRASGGVAHDPGAGEQGGQVKNEASGSPGEGLEGLGRGRFRDDEHIELEKDSPMIESVDDGEDVFDQGGIECNLVDLDAATSPTKGLSQRSRGFTSAVRRQMHASGATYFASLLCTTTVLMNSLEPAQLFEVNGVNATGHFGHMVSAYGITYDGCYHDTGWRVEKKNVATEVVHKVKEMRPDFVWFAPAVKGDIQEWAQESPGARRNRQRAQRRFLEVALQLSDAACSQVTDGRDFAWEVPADIRYWKNNRAEKAIQDAASSCGRKLYTMVVNGCFYPKASGAHGKSWVITTTSPQLAAVLRRCRCPGHKDHEIPEGAVKFPSKMVEEILDGIRWEFRVQGTDLDTQLRDFLSKSPTSEAEDLPKRDEQVMAVTTTKLPSLAPSGARLRQVKENMMRLHRAAGHTSFENLARLLQRRGSPEWAVELARSLSCDDCAEVRRQTGPPLASAEQPPSLWEILGMDVFEYEYKLEGKPMKAKFLLMIDRASRFVMTHLLQNFPADQAWEPTTFDIKKAIVKTWMGANPSPKWLYTDAAPYFTSREMIDFTSRSGLGLMTAPAEAHYLMGIEERAIQVVKRTVEKLELEDLGIGIESLFVLACHGHNSFVHVATGYSPFQWARGWQRENALPIALDPKRAFGKTLLYRSKAEEAFSKADASMKLTKLANSVSRPVSSYAAGDLCMLWRARVNRQRGGWTGPLRVLLQEGTTVWMATGTTLIRAKLNQVRKCTEREKLVLSTQGTTIYQNAVGLEILLRGYRGKHFLDATAENPGMDIEEDLTPARAAVQPAPPMAGQDKDHWVVTETMVIRKHRIPRLSMFTTDRTKDCPLPEEELSGKRRTIIQRPGGAQIIEDHFREEARPRRALMERWTGETQFERRVMSRRAPPPAQRAPRSERLIPPQQVQIPTPEQQPAPQQAIIARFGKPATWAGRYSVLSSRTASKEGTTVRILGCGSRLDSSSNAISDGRSCCDRGTGNPSSSSDLRAVDSGTGNLPPQPEFLEEEHVSAAPYSSCEEDSSEEELRPDVPGGRGQVNYASNAEVAESYGGNEEFLAFACEILVTSGDLKKLTKKPKKATVWLSQKMMEKSKEVSWRSLTLAEKQEYDEAQAVEVTNVVRERAARALSAQELQGLDLSRVMSMRWVLTRKSSGTAKARLVVLGFQAPNLLEVETAAPTLSRTGRNVLLTAASNAGMEVETGDVTSAFLQSLQSLEQENLVVWAPIELAAMFGANPEDSGMLMKLTKAFYGLVHAPRKWHETVVKAMNDFGWHQMKSDRCVFALRDNEGKLCALAGLHVDDFLIAGLPGHYMYLRAKAELQRQFRFGKWEQATGEGFVFAGCRIRQTEAGVQLDQEEYVGEWVQEIPISPHRVKQVKSSVTQAEIGELRAALGTLSWKASQSGPQFQAEVSLLLSEVPHATVDTLLRVNKLVREVKRTASQRILFPSWHLPWSSVCAMVWADASQGNRPNKSSTVGYVGCLGPRTILDGAETSLALVTWKSTKAPRESLGSNGSEVQAITIGEDIVFLLRAMWFEVHGGEISRYNLMEDLKAYTSGGLVMDSKGIFDAMTRNVSALHGLRSSRAGFELTVSVLQAVSLNTKPRWVNGSAQLADSLTKYNATVRKSFLEFLAKGQRWSVVHDPSFTAGKKLSKRQLQQQLSYQETLFVKSVRAFAEKSHFPWKSEDHELHGDIEPRNLKDVLGM